MILLSWPTTMSSSWFVAFQISPARSSKIRVLPMGAGVPARGIIPAYGPGPAGGFVPGVVKIDPAAPPDDPVAPPLPEPVAPPLDIPLPPPVPDGFFSAV